jgi:hypothetical protein
VLGCATLTSCRFVWKYQISHPETPRCMHKAHEIHRACF